MSPDAGKERVGKNGADYHLRVLIVRRSAHIIQNIILFVMMIQTLSFTAFWLDPIQELSDRLQVVRRNVCFEFDPLSLQHNKTGTHTSTHCSCVQTHDQRTTSVRTLHDRSGQVRVLFLDHKIKTRNVSFQNTHTHTQVHLRSNDHAVCSGIYALASQEIWYLRRFDVFSNSCGFLRASTHLGSLGFVRCVLRVEVRECIF